MDRVTLNLRGPELSLEDMELIREASFSKRLGRVVLHAIVALEAGPTEVSNAYEDNLDKIGRLLFANGMRKTNAYLEPSLGYLSLCVEVDPEIAVADV